MQCLQSMSKEIARQMETFQEGYISFRSQGFVGGFVCGYEMFGM